MPKFDDTPEDSGQEPLRILGIGDSGAGKTGSLVSLLPLGYRLRIADFDNNLASLRYQVQKRCPELAGQVEFMSFRDIMSVGPLGPTVVGGAKAYVNFSKALNKWEDGSNPMEDWTSNDILVLDTLTAAGRAAFNYAKALNSASKDGRQWYNAAQEAIEAVTGCFTSKSFPAHTIVLSHIDSQETNTGVKFFTSAIGKAIGPKYPRHFSTFLLYETTFKGKDPVRVIRSVPTRDLPLKNPAPDILKPEYPLETGLGAIFQTLTNGDTPK